MSAYIPTNVISITDGQIFLEAEMFYKGVKPAVSYGLSVSRIGSAAQDKSLKNLSSSLKLELAQFREVEIFSQFDSELDLTTQMQLIKGESLIESLKQDQYSPLPLEYQLILINFAVNGFFDQLGSTNIFWLKKYIYFLVSTLFSIFLNIFDYSKKSFSLFYMNFKNWYSEKVFSKYGLKEVFSSYFNSWNSFKFFFTFFFIRVWLNKDFLIKKSLFPFFTFFFNKFYLKISYIIYDYNIRFYFLSILSPFLSLKNLNLFKFDIKSHFFFR